MRKTKIICTMGPACANKETLTALFKAGMNVARLNFSHGDHDEHLAHIQRIRKIRSELHIPVAFMQDTKGPEYRIRSFAEGRVTLKEGERFTFTTRQEPGDEHHVSVSYAGLARDLAPGDRILLNNGLLHFEVLSTTDEDVECRVLIGGEVTNNKSMSFPGRVLNQVYLSEQDKADLLFGIEQDADFIACSFVSCRQDLLDVKEFLVANGGGHIELIAKIENRAGIDNIEEICQECSGIMIGRGDLGVEIPLEELPTVQKHLITKCRMLGKRVITATEMLESMIHSPRPTRAEASDVANAVYDGTSAVMLSGE
ncbi:MAG: pyruvate kinase, partial [Clostridia bacterium]|nr:pyruvate kinase [Clostridia bacterium]